MDETKKASNKPAPVGSVDFTDTPVDPDIWPNKKLPDFMLPGRNWKQYYADKKAQKNPT